MLKWRHCSFVYLVNFSYWSKLHVNVITALGVMTIYFYKALTRNLEIGNTSTWVFSNIWRLVQVRDAQFGTPVGNYMFKGNNRDTRTRYEICSKLTIKTPERRQNDTTPCPSVLLLTLSRLMSISTDVSSEILLNAAKCQGYGFYRFWVIKGKPTGWEGGEG